MEIVVPELGESIVEATIARWLKKKGDRVTVGETVVELETDKVDLEVGANEDGVLSEIRHEEGEDVQVGEVLGIIEPSGEKGPPPKEVDRETAPREEEQPVEESKASASPTADVVPQPRANAAAGDNAHPTPTGERSLPETPSAGERITPVAMRMARELNIDPSKIPTSGPGERITKEDVQRYIDSQRAGASRPAEPVKAEIRQPEPTRQEPKPARTEPVLPIDEGQDRRQERVRMSRRRRTIAARLVEAQQTAAILTTFNDVDMSAVMALRKRRQEDFQQRHGIKLGIMSFFVKATIGALKAFPELNAEIQGDEIVLKHYYDIGIAVGAEEGLVVPILRNADRMSFADIEIAIRDYIEKVRSGSLTLEDLRGGTFSITNGGVFGSLLSTPILNPPQVGILGLHRMEDRPVAIDGQVAIRPMMYLALSYDHRVVDGREAVQFLVRVKNLIEDPETLLLEG